MKTDGLLIVLFILFHFYSYKNKWSTNVTFYYYIKPNFRSHSCKINKVAVLWAATLHVWWSRIMHIKFIYNSQLSFRRDKTIKFPGRKHFCLYWHQNEAVKWTQIWNKSKDRPFWACPSTQFILRRVITFIRCFFLVSYLNQLSHVGQAARKIVNAVMMLTQYTRRARRGGLQEERHSIKTKGKMLVTRKSSSMTRGDHKIHKLYGIPDACAEGSEGIANRPGQPFCPPGADLYSMLSSMSLPAKTANVPMMHTAMNTQSRMWSKTMATNFHSSAAWN